MTTDNTNYHIHVIDDDKVLTSIVSKVLKKSGYVVTTSNNGNTGLLDFEEHKPDLVLLDVIMPDIDGYTTCKKLRLLHKDESLPILMMTGLEDVDSINKAFQAGATDFITKPLNLPLLGERIRYALRTKKLHNKTIQQSTELSAIFNSSNDAIITTNSNNIIIKVNSTAESMFQRDAHELLDHDISHIIPGLTSNEIMLNTYFQTEGKAQNENTFPIEINVSRIELNNEKVYAYFIKDISERLKIELMRTAFIQTVSHELRTPIAAIKGALAMLSGTAELDNPNYPLYKLSNDACDRLENVVNDIIDVSLLEDPSENFNLTSILIDDILSDVAIKSQSFAERFNSTLNIDLVSCENKSNYLTTDLKRASKAIQNVVNNALKFSEKESIVNIIIENNNEHIIVYVDDNGPGLSEEHKELIFQKFTQVDNSSTRKVGGNGLGLYVTKLTMDKLNGTVDYQTRDEGGTRFSLTFPRRID